MKPLRPRFSARASTHTATSIDAVPSTDAGSSTDAATPTDDGGSNCGESS